jgi:hypothetical protein
MLTRSKKFSSQEQAIATHLICSLPEHHIIIYDNLLQFTEESRLWGHRIWNASGMSLIEFLRRVSSIRYDYAASAGIDTVIENPMKTMEVKDWDLSYLKAGYGIGILEGIERFINFQRAKCLASCLCGMKTSTNLQPVGKRDGLAVGKLAGNISFAAIKQFLSQ